MQAQAATYQSESLLFSALVQLAVIVVVARLANVGLRRLGQPGAVGEILAGLLLGPSLLGYLLPNVSEHLFAKAAAIPVGIVSQIGLILLMFQIGSEFAFAHLAQKQNRSAVTSIAAASIAVPLLSGGLIGWLSAAVLAPHVNRITYCSFLAVAMAITAVPTLGRILRELDLTRTRLGVVTITAAAINDVVGWILLAIISAAATSRFSFWATAAQFAGIVTFGLLLWWGGRPAAAYLLRRQPVADGNISPLLMSIVLGFCSSAQCVPTRLESLQYLVGSPPDCCFMRTVRSSRRGVGKWVNLSSSSFCRYFLPTAGSGPMFLGWLQLWTGNGVWSFYQSPASANRSSLLCCSPCALLA
jgi:Kef-type K+ transport system membrane component KefB